MATTSSKPELYYIGVFRNEPQPTHELCAEMYLLHWGLFTRYTYGEFLKLFSKKVAQETEPGHRLEVKEQENKIYSFRRKDFPAVTGIVMTNTLYSDVAASRLLAQVVDDFIDKFPKSSWETGTPTLAWPELKERIVKYQTPENVDSILKIQKELDDTTQVMHKTIESVLQRGEKIDDLVAKSDGLSKASKAFYRTTATAKKQNSCCIVM